MRECDAMIDRWMDRADAAAGGMVRIDRPETWTYGGMCVLTYYTCVRGDAPLRRRSVGVIQVDDGDTIHIQCTIWILGHTVTRTPFSCKRYSYSPRLVNGLSLRQAGNVIFFRLHSRSAHTSLYPQHHTHISRMCPLTYALKTIPHPQLYRRRIYAYHYTH